MEFSKFILVAAYVPNSGDKLQRLKYRVDSWDVDFQSYLTTLQSKGKMVILAGDLNVAHNELDICNVHERRVLLVSRIVFVR